MLIQNAATDVMVDIGKMDVIYIYIYIHNH